MKERIRAIMESKGMTQQEFSQFLEMSPASLSSIFTGRTNPTLNVVDSIKKKFDNINLEWLMFGNGPMFISDDAAQESNIESPEMTDGTGMENSSCENFSSPNLQYRNGNQADAYRCAANKEGARNNSYATNVSSFSDMKIINNNVRKIKEIRVFYDDQTYESFVPKE